MWGFVLSMTHRSGVVHLQTVNSSCAEDGLCQDANQPGAMVFTGLG